MRFLTFIFIVAYYQISAQSISLSSGLTFPINSYENYWSNGINITTSAGIKVKSNLSVNLNFEYHNLSDKKFSQLINIGNLQTISIYPSIKFDLRNSGSVIYPYIYSGLGWLNYSNKNASFLFIDIDTESKSILILLIGFGMEYSLTNNLKLFVDSNYRYGSIDNYRIDFLPIKAGISYLF